MREVGRAGAREDRRSWELFMKKFPAIEHAFQQSKTFLYNIYIINAKFQLHDFRAF
jgi:hypothetical protein